VSRVTVKERMDRGLMLFSEHVRAKRGSVCFEDTGAGFRIYCEQHVLCMKTYIKCTTYDIGLCTIAQRRSLHNQHASPCAYRNARSDRSPKTSDFVS
jgi:hypothetical protein